MRMRDKLFFLFMMAFSLIFPATAETPKAAVQGTWKAKITDVNHARQEHVNLDEFSKGKIQFNFYYKKNLKELNQGSSFDFIDFEGLNEERAKGSNTSVNFRLVREAGIFELEGKFNKGDGQGTFRFFEQASFVHAMHDRGFLLNQEQIFSAAFLDITTAFVDEIKTMGFKKLQMEDFFKAKIFRIDPAFVKEMAANGFSNLALEELVKARVFKVDTTFVREVAGMGFENLELEDLIKFKNFEITQQFVNEMKKLGLTNLTIENVVSLKIFKVDANFIRHANSKSGRSLKVEELINFKIHGKIL
ncbi:hypothetical protein [Undibacterium danionis]|uniref:Pentapeptide repeat-containing protein n=1 Tax=Undibacterium danionis TaxID=1812100 RepID=A0ABV6IC42_9BURK